MPMYVDRERESVLVETLRSCIAIEGPWGEKGIKEGLCW